MHTLCQRKPSSTAFIASSAGMLVGMTTYFDELGLSEKVLAAIEDMGYTQPTPVQEQAIPAVLAVGMLIIDPISGIIALVMLPFIVLYMRMLGANAKEAARKQHGKFQVMSNHFIDTLRGLATLQLLGRSKGYEKEVYQV